MRHSFLARVFAVGLALAAAPFASAQADDLFSPVQKDAIGEIVHQYLIDHPEVLRDAMQALDKKDREASAAAQEKALTDSASLVFASQHQADVGDPQGKTTLVEFFDY